MAISTTRNDAQLDEARLRVEKASNGIAKGKFGPKVGFQCSFCPYRNLCPATERSVAVPQKKRAN